MTSEHLEDRLRRVLADAASQLPVETPTPASVMAAVQPVRRTVRPGRATQPAWLPGGGGSLTLFRCCRWRDQDWLFALLAHGGSPTGQPLHIATRSRRSPRGRQDRAASDGASSAWTSDRDHGVGVMVRTMPEGPRCGCRGSADVRPPGCVPWHRRGRHAARCRPLPAQPPTDLRQLSGRRRRSATRAPRPSAAAPPPAHRDTDHHLHQPDRTRLGTRRPLPYPRLR